MKHAVLFLILGIAVSFTCAQDSTKTDKKTNAAILTNKGDISSTAIITTGKVRIVTNDATNIVSKAEVKTEDLPSSISGNILKDYAGYNIINAFGFENNPDLKYEVIIEKDTGRIFLFYDSNGKFLRKREARRGKDINYNPVQNTIPANQQK